jgi:hypothetical protein
MSAVHAAPDEGDADLQWVKPSHLVRVNPGVIEEGDNVILHAAGRMSFVPVKRGRCTPSLPPPHGLLSPHRGAEACGAQHGAAGQGLVQAGPVDRRAVRGSLRGRGRRDAAHAA